MSCEYFPDCPFFKSQLAQWPAVAKMYQTNYCHSSVLKCARYLVRRFCGPEVVPDNLFPNDAQGAERIVKSNQLTLRSS